MIGSSRVVAVIPARGGSKGIPDKNLQRVGGLALIERTVRTALGAESVDEVVVSTDSTAIGELAVRAGARLVERPDAIAGDLASSESALRHALDTIGTRPDILVFMQCTSPFTSSADVDNTVALIGSGCDSAFTAYPATHFLWRTDGETAVGVNHDLRERQRRQDRPPEYCENGAVYAMVCNDFVESGHRFFGRVGISPMDATRSLEIDEPEDLELARVLAPRLEFASAPSGLRALVMDFDGVLTDDLVYTAADGTETVACSRGDGLGLQMLREQTEISLLILSREKNAVVAARAAKLQVPCQHGVDDKLSLLQRWGADLGYGPGEIAYVGNDANDVECMRWCGWSVAPADAHRSAIAAADLVLTAPGGRGAIREVADLLLRAQQDTQLS